MWVKPLDTQKLKSVSFCKKNRFGTSFFWFWYFLTQLLAKAQDGWYLIILRGMICGYCPQSRAKFNAAKTWKHQNKQLYIDLHGVELFVMFFAFEWFWIKHDHIWWNPFLIGNPWKPSNSNSLKSLAAYAPLCRCRWDQHTLASLQSTGADEGGFWELWTRKIGRFAQKETTKWYMCFLFRTFVLHYMMERGDMICIYLYMNKFP